MHSPSYPMFSQVFMTWFFPQPPPTSPQLLLCLLCRVFIQVTNTRPWCVLGPLITLLSHLVSSCSFSYHLYAEDSWIYPSSPSLPAEFQPQITNCLVDISLASQCVMVLKEDSLSSPQLLFPSSLQESQHPHPASHSAPGLWGYPIFTFWPIYAPFSLLTKPPPSSTPSSALSCTMVTASASSLSPL